ncbi:putative toxin-antitoxin system toxin component, PIN family [Azospirillum sp. SYSU D00513]|uniref:putative toxin-antitoxin system toxin component, PIN family n=1 Tax=Azospirillum sp. SYSU D00513 TaxID=2812561 RepID=UPI001FFFE962|nr:putative toxin-antitoxin system toxin component, PIN family [Azospirillum sp. SYSU D00513]
MHGPHTMPAEPLFRAVLDTNVLVAYALLGEGVSRRDEAVRNCVETALATGELLASEDTLAELRAVLTRPDFERYKPAAERERSVAAFTARSRLVRPAEIGRLCRDPEDDMFLAVALAGDADWLVTVDRQLLSVRGIGRTRILRPARFLEALPEAARRPGGTARPGGPGDGCEG